MELNQKAGKKVIGRLQKAWHPRWPSFDKSVSSVFNSLVSVLQTLRELKDDTSCYGLLQMFLKLKHIGTLFILNSVLPKLSHLSKLFQAGNVSQQRIEPVIKCCQAWYSCNTMYSYMQLLSCHHSAVNRSTLCYVQCLAL